jgi:lipopolysaccharide/colanic/teichoic acid biosynthesis glycosyltransferase
MRRMSKRLVDLVIASLLLVLSLPVLLLAALLIRLETPGAAWYLSPRLGRGGRRFGLLRMRTVDPRRPASAPMAERLSRVGRLLRELSLDDLPNLLNVLRGDLSLVGPRPMEPDRVDLADPAWQRVLSVRPGLVSLAIVRLASAYNSSPLQVRHALELEYVARQSLAFDLRLLVEGLVGLVRSRGNIKTRGVSTARRDRMHE